MIEGTPILAYKFGGELGIAGFSRRCPNCGRFVVGGDVEVNGLGDVRDVPNGICTLCGPIKMEFLGWFGEDEI